jgi:hypothetical protein
LDTIEIKRPITVKVIMTQGFKDQLIGEARETLNKLEMNLKIIEEQMMGQISNLAESDPERAINMSQQLEADQEKLKAMKAELSWKIRELESTENGAEYPLQMLEGSVSVRIGDNLLERLSKCEVLIKDWKVLEIRHA